jgi:LysR family transcriptional activator of nhaA
MQQLNYHHLLYFWTVAQEGSLGGGAQKLNLTPQTISTQLRTLEDALGEQLFDRSRRQLTMTEIGRLVYDYADDIFALGRELTDAVKGQPTGRPLKLLIGVADVLPKLVAHRLIDPALHLAEEVQIECLEDKTERLLAQLAVHGLDVVLSDAPIPSTVNIRAFNHLLGECGVTIMAAPALIPRYRKGFPQSLHDAPFLLPAEGTTLRRSLAQWFDQIGVHPRVVGEFEDSALLKTFGQAGSGVFAVPSVVTSEVQRQYQVRKIGEADGIIERFYAISVERKIQHPAVAAICDTARKALFA